MEIFKPVASSDSTTTKTSEPSASASRTSGVGEAKEATLERLGLTQASKTLKTLRDRKRKLAIAYEHYRYLTPEKIKAFRQKVNARTAPSGYRMDVVIQTLSEYAAVPPEDVLQKLEEAIDRKCFDGFEVLRVDAVKVDPLLLGIVEGCKDKFFVAQWDTDVSIEEILKDNEG